MTIRYCIHIATRAPVAIVFVGCGLYETIFDEKLEKTEEKVRIFEK